MRRSIFFKTILSVSSLLVLFFIQTVNSSPTPLTITKVKPDHGTTAGGTLITIKGDGFESGATVTVANDTCSNVTVFGPHKITCVTPAHAAIGYYDVKVINPNGEFAIKGKGFKYVNPPIVLGIDPEFGPTAGGTFVTIMGTNFKAGAYAKIGGIDCTNPTVVSNSELTCTTGPNPVGLADVAVFNPNNVSGDLPEGYEYKANYWTDIPLSIVGGRMQHTAVWTGTQMIVWGGQNNSGFLGVGGVYDPVQSTWQLTSSTGAPSARVDHSAVWTGSKMILWGGAGYNGFYNDGYFYDPVNGWSLINGTGAPSVRSNHQAIWTGSEMWVWGGTFGGFPPSSGGGKFNPATGTWTSITTTNQPVSRKDFTAIWTGSKMIIWGGASGGGGTFYADGAIYDPATGWTALPSSGLSARTGHTAVWTGSKMIIWGGYTASGPVGDGKIYDPSTNTWSSMNTSGVLSARSGHTAVWIDDKMIVWGGVNTTNALADGAAYDLNSGWTPINMTGAPSPRSDHTVVWTGTQMIVWGGNGPPFGYQGTGGIYTP